MTILATALDLHQAGYTVIPIRPDGTKAPTGPWKQYIENPPTCDQITAWFDTPTPPDLAVLQGACSGNAELTELEAAATPHLPEIITTLTEQGLGGLWQTLITGWVESSPSGGLHLHYRLTEPVPGNTKIAADSDHRTLAETRGEGGYVIVAPSQHHPSGKAWTRLTGGPTTTPTITMRERDQLHAILREVLHHEPETPAPTPPRPTSVPRNAAAGMSPGDDFESRTTWDEILTPHGWTRTRQDGNGWAWTRPDKNPRDGISATTGKDPERDRLYVFTSSTLFTPDTPYTKFGAHALLNHGGDHTAAARQLAKDGYGTPSEPHMDLTGLPTTPTRTATTVDGNLATVTPLPAPRTLTAAPGSTLQHSDDANALKLVDTYGQEIRYVTDRGRWITWNGHQWQWAPSGGGTVREYAKKIARNLPEDTEKALTHKKRSLSAVGTTAMIQQAETDDRITIPLDDLDAHGHELNTPAGIVNLRTSQIDPPDPARLHTRSTTVSPDSAHPTPRWDAFLTDTFAGHDDLAPYIQELAGYSATGTVTHHVLPFLHGPGGNGKSVFLDVLRALLGDYAGSAPSKFLMANSQQHETEIARLSGLRMVITSEVNQEDKFDEAKVKLLTGGDALTARFMRQDHFTFTPTHHLWLMGNHQPKVSGGGESFWRRLRLIPFTNTVPDDKKIDNLAELLITEEGPGILAWIIEGAQKVLANGMHAPESVLAATTTYATEEDALARFITDRCMTDNPNLRIETSTLRAAYTKWCDLEGDKPLSPQVFGRELRTRFGIEQHRSNGKRFYIGIALYADPDDEPEEEWWQ